MSSLEGAGTMTEVRWLSARRARHFVGAPGRLIGVIANPLIYLFVFTVLFAGAFVVPHGYAGMVDYVTAGVVLIVAISAIPTGAISVRLDLENGFMDRLRTLPVRRPSIVASYLVTETFLILVVTTVVLGVARALGWRPVEQGEALWVAAGLILAMAFLCSCVAVLLGMLLQTATTIDAVASLLTVIFAFFSNVLLPLSAQPEALRQITRFNPINPVADALRRMWQFGDVGSSPLILAALVAVGLALASVLVWLFGRRAT